MSELPQLDTTEMEKADAREAWTNGGCYANHESMFETLFSVGLCRERQLLAALARAEAAETELAVTRKSLETVAGALEACIVFFDMHDSPATVTVERYKALVEDAKARAALESSKEGK